jgi:hypothetical protein
MDKQLELDQYIITLQTRGKGDIITLGELERECECSDEVVKALNDQGYLHRVRGLYFMITEHVRRYGKSIADGGNWMTTAAGGQ